MGPPEAKILGFVRRKRFKNSAILGPKIGYFARWFPDTPPGGGGVTPDLSGLGRRTTFS